MATLSQKDLKRVGDVLWEIPASLRSDMRVPARFYASEEMLESLFRDRSLDQLVNVAALPGIQGYALAMPDMHEGYGFPIGGVAATEHPEGVISPGGIGYDINCGVRLLVSERTYDEVRPHLEKLVRAIFNEVPSGVGRGGRLKLDDAKLNEVLLQGARWIVAQGYGDESDLRHIESSGSLPDADPEKVSRHAKSRGCDQLGTMGAGNHFVEIDVVEEIFDEESVRVFGLHKGQIVTLVHTGSRGLGHQVATDYIRKMLEVLPRYGIELPDRELACAPFFSNEGNDYFAAMSAAANFAWANRQLITYEVRKAWKDVLGEGSGKLAVLYDVAHNIAKVEEHVVAGSKNQKEKSKKKVIVHRKGATRAFPAGNPAVPEEYRNVGQPVLIPGSMGTASYVLAGTERAMEETFGSTCHGAGRQMSRHAAKRAVRVGELKQELESRGIHVAAGSISGLAEEAPLAYKDVNEVVDVVHRADIARKVARLKPVGVVKG